MVFVLDVIIFYCGYKLGVVIIRFNYFLWLYVVGEMVVFRKGDYKGFFYIKIIFSVFL